MGISLVVIVDSPRAMPFRAVGGQLGVAAAAQGGRRVLPSLAVCIDIACVALRGVTNPHQPESRGRPPTYF
jgi:hypothetical protein